MNNIKKRYAVSRCKFPGCGREIKRNARLCYRHIRVYAQVAAYKHNRGKSEAEIFAEAKEIDDRWQENRPWLRVRRRE
jgi:hypothetical protein